MEGGPFLLLGWMLAILAGALILPWLMETIPVIFEFIKNLVLWLVWVIWYRNKNS